MTLFDRVVDAGKSFACSIYRTQPGALIPNPISDVLKLSWDSLCGDAGVPGDLPPPPTIPFRGGQCGGVLYNVTVDAMSERGVLSQDLGFINIPGPIKSITPLSVPFNGGTEGEIRIDYQNTFQQKRFTSCNFSGVPTYCGFTDVRNIRISRQDGLPDNCGDPPKSYPSAPPPPPTGYTSPPTTIIYNDGDDFTAIFNLKPPTGDSPPPPDICLSVIIKGVEVKLCFPFGLPPSFGDGGGGDIADILADIQNSINNLQNDVDKLTDPPPPESDPDLNETDSPGDDGGEEDNLPGLKWVVVRLTALPVKAQFGTPSVNFAGWITFKIGPDYTDRIPIAFENGVFQAPPGATGYAITFTNKARGISKAYTQDIAP